MFSSVVPQTPTTEDSCFRRLADHVFFCNSWTRAWIGVETIETAKQHARRHPIGMFPLIVCGQSGPSGDAELPTLTALRSVLVYMHGRILPRDVHCKSSCFWFLLAPLKFACMVQFTELTQCKRTCTCV